MTTSVSTRQPITDTDGANRLRERNAMNSHLGKIADRWAKEEQQLDRSELHIRYRWAQDVKIVRDSPTRYGIDADIKLFETRMTSDLESRVYYNIATFIDESFFEAIVAFNESKPARRGHITWSHLIAFSRIGDADIRQSLLEQCTDEQWSVATLRAKVDDYFDLGLAESTTERRKSGAGSIAKRVLRSSQRLVKDTWVIFSKEFLTSLESVRESDIDVTLAQITEAKEALSECQVQLVTTEQALTIALTSLRSRCDTGKAVKSDAIELAAHVAVEKSEELTANRPLRKKKRRRVQPTAGSAELVTI